MFSVFDLNHVSFHSDSSTVLKLNPTRNTIHCCAVKSLQGKMGKDRNKGSSEEVQRKKCKERTRVRKKDGGGWGR